MQMNEYSMAKVIRLMVDHGLGDLVVDTEYHGRILTVHVAGRKC